MIPTRRCSEYAGGKAVSKGAHAFKNHLRFISWLMLVVSGCTPNSAVVLEPAPPVPLPGSQGTWPEPPSQLCKRYSPPIELGVISQPDLDEISGIVASRTYEDVYWVHNDSGDGGAIYSVDSTGSRLGTVTLDATAFDPEDIALGPAPDRSGDHLYLADIGDNFGFRSSLSLFRLPEPYPKGDKGRHAERIELLFPDGAVDAEAFAIDPVTGDGILVTKSEHGPAVVWRAPFVNLVDGSRILMHEIARVDIGAPVTAADFTPTGDRLALRSYDDIFLWGRTTLELGGLLAAAPCSIPAPDERQGEALGFLADGSIVTVSEGRDEAIYRLGAVP